MSWSLMGKGQCGGVPELGAHLIMEHQSGGFPDMLGQGRMWYKKDKGQCYPAWCRR